MKKSLTILGAVVLAVVFAGLAGAVTPAEAPESTTIDDCVNKKSAVEFPHSVHAGSFECVTCHHTQEGLTAESDMQVEACGTCHVEPEAAETPACSQMSLSKNPFHIACVGCHKEKVAEDETLAAPTKCEGCHPKAE